jgi:hypothetical protein
MLKIAEQNTSKSLGEPEEYYFQSQKKTNRDDIMISQNENKSSGTDLQQDDAWQ